MRISLKFSGEKFLNVYEDYISCLLLNRKIYCKSSSLESVLLKCVAEIFLTKFIGMVCEAFESCMITFTFDNRNTLLTVEQGIKIYNS